jgi:NAD-dependent SIR2 family protein deacetylase
MNPKTLLLAKKAWKDADAILVGAGAGMGVDSGLPDFRGKSGFWKAYPPLAKMGIEFEEMANPYWFTKNPSLAWGFTVIGSIFIKRLNPIVVSIFYSTSLKKKIFRCLYSLQM